MTTVSDGFVIALDGPDGVGKTAQVKLLNEYLLSKGYDVHVTRQAGGTPISERLREVLLSHDPRPPETEVYMSLAMGYALAKDIEKRRNNGQVVVIDRSPLAVLAYNGYGSQLQDISIAVNASKIMFEQLDIDLLLFLTADKSSIASRRAKRGTDDFFEKKDKYFHDRVDKGYDVGLELLQTNPKLVAHVYTINGEPDIDTVHQSIVKSVESYLSVFVSQ